MKRKWNCHKTHIKEMYFGSPKGQLSPNKHTPRNQQQLQKQNEAKIQAPQLPTDGKLAVY